MASLSLGEQLLLASLLAALLAGMAVKHWRDARRERPAAIASSPAPRLSAPSPSATP